MQINPEVLYKLSDESHFNLHSKWVKTNLKWILDFNIPTNLFNDVKDDMGVGNNFVTAISRTAVVGSIKESMKPTPPNVVYTAAAFTRGMGSGYVEVDGDGKVINHLPLADNEE